MKVTIISSTPDAMAVLLFTKATRLQMSPSLMEEIKAWPEEKKAAELQAMAKTIKSSWEFIDVVFLIEGVSRAAAQQITRTRNASYAMQSQRVTDMRETTFHVPESLPESAVGPYKTYCNEALQAYGCLVADGVALEDARGVLPMATHCNLVAKYNLRALTDVIKARKSLRAQGEYNSVALQMESETIKLWPWAAPFFVSDKQIAISMLETVAKEIGITTGKGMGWEIAKAIDLIQKD